MLPPSSLAARATHGSPIPSAPSTARQDTLSSIANHVSSMTSRITRLSAINQKVRSALASDAPDGMSRLDWIARRLNES